LPEGTGSALISGMKAAELQHQFYDMLMESQFWSPSQMQDYQRGQLEQLLRHARKNVPFYQTRLDPVFTDSGDIDWDRWKEIPVVKRSDMAEHRHAMRSPVLPRGHGPARTITSSGSTGHPVETLVTAISSISSDAAAWRSARWQNLDFSLVLAFRNGVEPNIVAPNPLRLGSWGPSWDDASKRGDSFRMTKLWTAAQQVHCMKERGAAYLAPGGAKSAAILALEAERLGLDHHLDRILVNGEEVAAEDRDVCRRVFGAEMVDLYSSKEGGHMADRCPTGPGYHINAERVLIELLDSNNQPVRHGEVGRVVITPFYNTAQPLIRYDQGDLAAFGDQCSCGRHLPVLRSIDGRISAIFHHPDGRKKSRGFPIRFLHLLEAQAWQIAQVGDIDFEIRYVPLKTSLRGDETAVATAFRRHMFEDAKVTFKRLDAVPLTASGKYLEYVNETQA
jgi:phenylacetate-CoA ligase